MSKFHQITQITVRLPRIFLSSVLSESDEEIIKSLVKFIAQNVNLCFSSQKLLLIRKISHKIYRFATEIISSNIIKLYVSKEHF